MNEIKPALTAEEWAGVCTVGRPMEVWGKAGGGGLGVVVNGLLDPSDRHALAAHCLNGQPFGFTREDVKWLHHAAAHAKPAPPEYRQLSDEIVAIYLDLADRIEALLPPEDRWDT